MSKVVNNRIESIDLLKGIVMVIMALDHTRDFFHFSSFYFDPTDPSQSTLPIFFTRWITHFCAPTFSFLAGLSAFFIARRKTLPELSRFLFTRGLWLVFIELTIVNFGWYFDFQFRTPGLLTIWSLGVSMMVLAALIHLPSKLILAISIIIIFGHNLLDGIHFENSVVWSILHEFNIFKLGNGYNFIVGYPLIPWIAVMSLGYCFGTLYDASFDSNKRRKILNTIGLSSLFLFITLRFINVYGDLFPWEHYPTLSQNCIAFLNPAKYPPSLLYLLMTLGGSLLFLANSEKLKGAVVSFFSTFGRVPFFFYIIHIYFIHLGAMLMAQLSGYGWHSMVLPFWVGEIPELKGYGCRLSLVYLIWIGIIALTYPLCKKFDAYKMNHKEKWWLSYL